MKIVKWKKPFEERLETDPVILDTPFSGLLQRFFEDELFNGEFASFVPSVNIAEEKDRYVMEVSAPGFEKADLNMEIKGEMLIISGEHRVEREVNERKFSRKEFNYGSFHRTFPLHDNINKEMIEANYVNGILKIFLPKREVVQEENKRIEIK